jgi:hypothetical protein
LLFSNVGYVSKLELTQLAVNTQIHPAAFGGIAKHDYIRKFIYAQGAIWADFCPLTCSGMQGFYHISLFSQPETGKWGFD